MQHLRAHLTSAASVIVCILGDHHRGGGGGGGTSVKFGTNKSSMKEGGSM
jgi:hypothetical protein